MFQFNHTLFVRSTKAGESGFSNTADKYQNINSITGIF